MNNAPAILRSLITFALIVPLAVVVGYMLTNPLDYSSLGIFGLLALALVSPLLMKWHYPVMLFCWNTAAVAFFVKGAPGFSLVMITLSLGISVAERMLSQGNQFIRVPQITWPLLFLIGVVLFTAKMTGGFGLRAFGSEVYGGKKYVFLIVGILGYFALTARRIPPQKAGLYVSLFILGQLTQLIGDLYPLAPSGAQFIFWIFPPSIYYSGTFQIGETRLGGVGSAGSAILFWLAAKYGVRGVFLSAKLWRPALFAIAFVMVFLGGFRATIVIAVTIYGLLFFLERLHRTRMVFVVGVAGLLAAAVIVPLAPHLPFTFQRALAFLPLNISQEARASAEVSSNWRFEMWKALLPQISQHLLVGKGYAITAEDFQMMGYDSSFHAVDPSQQGLALASDYHNGPISVILPFGILGVIVVVWFLATAAWVVYRNYRYGDPSLRLINAFLLATFVTRTLLFLFIFGALNNDMVWFAGTIGLSIALNGGVCQPAPQPDPAKQARNLVRPFPRPRPVFQRYRTGL